MKKAEYMPNCQGHFGLGFTYYCHFTSPIRRYPDLMIHRIIKAILRGQMNDEVIRKLSDSTAKAAEISSIQERVAIDAERTIEKKKKAQYMYQHIGQEFEGIVSGVLNSGFFVELANTIEGYVPLETLKDDYYNLNAEKYCIVGENRGKIYRVGDHVNVIVDVVNLATDEIDFKIVDNNQRFSGKERFDSKNGRNKNGTRKTRKNWQ